MSTKQFNARIQHKIDTWENWSKAENFFPLKGELIIYTTDEEGNEKLGLKIGNGDGITNVHNLPFLQSDTGFIQSDWMQEDSSASNFIKNKPGDLVEQIGNIETKVFSMEAKGDGVQEIPNYYSWSYIADAPYPAIHESEKLKIKVKNSLEEIIFEETKELSTDESIDQVLSMTDDQTGYYVIYNSNQSFLEALTNGPDNSPMICIALCVSDTYYQIIFSADQNYSDLTIELYSVEDAQIENYIKLSNNALDLEEEVTASSQKPVTSKGIYKFANNIKTVPYYIPCRLSNFVKDGVQYIKAEFPEDKDLQLVHQEAIDAYKQGRPIKLFDELTETYVETLASVETSLNPSEEDSWMFIFDVSFQSVMVKNLIYFSSGGFSNLAYPIQEKLNITDKIELANIDPVQSGAVYSALLQIQENVIAIAEGQTNSYVFTYKARPLNDSTTSEIDILNEWLEISDEDGVLNKDKLKNGDVFFIRATDEPDYWWDKTSQLPQVLEAKTNLNNYVQKEELNNYATLDLLGGFRLQKAIEYKADRTIALEAGTIEYDVNEKQIYEWDELGNRSGPNSPLEDVIYIVKEG